MDSDKDNLFQVSVKGLCFDQNHKLMMIEERIGYWDLPGGRMHAGEKFIECLKRECLEETGLACEIISQEPLIVYPALGREGGGRIMVYFDIALKNFDFKASAECVNIGFYTKDEIKSLNTYPQLKELLNYL